MNNSLSPAVFISLLITLMGGLSACSTIDRVKSVITDDNAINYQNNQAVKLLEVPPDLTTPEFDNSFDLPTGAVSAVSLRNGSRSTVARPSTLGSNLGAVRRGDLSTIRIVAGKSVLQVNDTYSRSLILTEIVLNRMGFSTTSKSSRGDTITTRYNGNDVLIKSQSTGFLSKMKNLVRRQDNNKALVKGGSYKFAIKNKQNGPVVTVSSVTGAPLSNDAHTKIINMLNKAFNR